MLPTHCIYTNTHTQMYNKFFFFYIKNILDVNQTWGAKSQRCLAMISFKSE